LKSQKSHSADRPRRRRRRFFSTQEAAEKFLRVFKSQLRDLGTSQQILKPVDAVDANEAIQLLKRHAIKHGIRGPKLRDIADEWVHRNEQHRSVSLAKLFDPSTNISKLALKIRRSISNPCATRKSG
jgi:hypothetical protein